jgi:protease-4
MAKSAQRRTGSGMIWGGIKGFFGFLFSMVVVLQRLLFTLAVLAGVGIAIYVLTMDRTPDVPKGAALVLNPHGVIVEQRTPIGPFDNIIPNPLAGERIPEVELRDVLDAIAFAKEDDRIGALVLHLDRFTGTMPSKLHDVAAALRDFKESGKPVIAMGNGYQQHQYFLAAHADRILMHPYGMVLVTGYGSYRTFYASLLEKLDVTVNLFRVGEYKSAMEPFIRDDMSPEDRVSRLGFLQPLWDEYERAVEAARGLERGALTQGAAQFGERMRAVQGDMARLAVESGLVDELVTREEQRQHVIDIVGKDEKTKSFKQVAFSNYLKERRASERRRRNGTAIAVVTATGNIVDGEAPQGTIGGDSVARLIRLAHQDDDVKAIVLRVDSGGGSAFASEVIRNELSVAQDKGIKVVASMGSVAASGGYWISATADEIWAAPTTITGSIGIFGMFLTFENTAAKLGVYSDGVGTTPLAGAFDPLRPINPELRVAIQEVIEEGYRRFLSLVADARGMTVEEVDRLARGRVWTGADAKEFGLVDHLGGLSDAIEAAARLAEIEDYRIWRVTAPQPLWRQMLRQFFGEAALFLGLAERPAAPLLPHAAQEVMSDLMILRQFNDPQGIYAICEECMVRP